MWTVGTLSVLFHHRPDAYQQLLQGNLDVGNFIQILSETAAWPIVQLLASVISLVAIVKSSLGIGLGLLETWHAYFKDKIGKISIHGMALILTVIPPLLVSLWIPQLFLKALRFAGLSLTMIAIFMPLWLINRSALKQEKTFYRLIRYPAIQWFCLTFGLIIVLCECYNFSRP